MLGVGRLVNRSESRRRMIMALVYDHSPPRAWFLRCCQDLLVFLGRESSMIRSTGLGRYPGRYLQGRTTSRYRVDPRSRTLALAPMIEASFFRGSSNRIGWTLFWSLGQHTGKDVYTLGKGYTLPRLPTSVWRVSSQTGLISTMTRSTIGRERCTGAAHWPRPKRRTSICFRFRPTIRDHTARMRSDSSNSCRAVILKSR